MLLQHLSKPACVVRKEGHSIEICAYNESFNRIFKIKEHSISCKVYSTVITNLVVNRNEEVAQIIKNIQKAFISKKSSAFTIDNIFEHTANHIFSDSLLEITNTPIIDVESGEMLILQTINEKQQKINGKKLNETNTTATTEKFIQDIKTVKAKLSKSERRFRSLVQDGSDLIAILDAQGNYSYVSPTSKFILDMEPNEFIGLNAFDFIHPEDIETTHNGFLKLGIEKKIELQPFRFRHKNGSWRWVETIITDLRNDPSIMGIVANSRDVTEKILSQLALEKSNERYEYVLKATSDAIWDCDLQTGHVFWAEAFRLMFGYTKSVKPFTMSNWNQKIHPEDIASFTAGVSNFLNGEETKWESEYRWLKSNGHYAYIIDMRFVIRNESGKAVRMVGAIKDITERKKEEQRLKLLESLVTQTTDAVTITEFESIDYGGPKITYVNQAFTKMTGYTFEEVIGKSPGFLHGPKTSQQELQILNEAIKNWQPVEVTVLNYRKNGEEFWMNFSATPIADEKGKFTNWIAIQRDVTESKIAEAQKLLISEISQIFNRGSKLSNVLKLALNRITEVGNLYIGELWLLDSEEKNLRLIAKSVNHPDARKFYHPRWNVKSVKLGSGLPGRVWETGSSEIWTSNCGKPLIREESAKCAGIIELLGIPLSHNNEITGVMVLGFSGLENSSFVTKYYENLGRYLGSEIKRRQLEKELDQIFSFAPDILSITTFDGYFKKINPAGCRLLGYSSAEIQREPITYFLHPEDKQAVLNRLPKIGKSSETFSFENRCITKSGKIRWLAWTANVVPEEGLVYSVGRDITEKKNLEDLLNKSNSLANIGSWEINLPNKSVYWSEITKKIRETPDGFVPDLDTEIKHYKGGKNRNTFKKRLDGCIKDGLSWDEELEITTFQNKSKWIRSIGQAELLNGKLIRIYGSFQDINDRKKAEIEAGKALIALEQSEKRYSGLFQLSPLPMWVYDVATLKFLEVNQAATEHYGYNPEEFMNLTIRDIRPVSGIPILDKVLKRKFNALNNHNQGIFIHKKKDGSLINVEIKSSSIVLKEKMSKVIIVNGITERLNYYNAIAEQNAKLRDIAHIQSHVVRAPLSRLMGLVYILKNKLIQKEMSDEQIIAAIEASAQELDLKIREIVDNTVPYI
ncbi:PAS domain S-box protein [Pedobacter lithocola]|uniref:histidine kinase n=1 Tax=Pedobacter lithocola TaxID=1908239 RepID=A0ABV8P701_9SPHI